MTDHKPPTDAAILKGFQKFEEGMNVALAVLPKDSIDREFIWEAHAVFRDMAADALRRQEAKKEK